MVGFNRIAPLMQQPVMLAAEQEAIVQAGFAAIGPMHHVMRVQPPGVCTSGIAAVFVAGEQGAFQRR